jgi:serine/threonine-protein phosphatase 2A regulatory subunit B'
VAHNIFRPLPAGDRQSDFDPEEEEPLLEESWPHLQVCYFALRLFMNDNVPCSICLASL